MQTEINLTDRQQEIMLTAAVDHEGRLEPAATLVNIRGAAFTNMMHTLRNAGLAEGEDAETRLIPAGYATISVDAPASAEQNVQETASGEPEEIVEAAPEAEADTSSETETETATAPEPEAAPEPETLTKKPRKMRSGTKQATIIEMLQRAEGASLHPVQRLCGFPNLFQPSSGKGAQNSGCLPMRSAASVSC